MTAKTQTIARTMTKSQANVINELTKKLLKGKEARSKNLRQELRDMRERCDKEKTILNKTIADIEADKETERKIWQRRKLT